MKFAAQVLVPSSSSITVQVYKLTRYLPPLYLSNSLSVSYFDSLSVCSPPPLPVPSTSFSLPPSLLDSLSLQTAQGTVVLKAVGSVRQDRAAAVQFLRST